MGSSVIFTTGGLGAALISASRFAMLDGGLTPGEVTSFGIFEFAADQGGELCLRSVAPAPEEAAPHAILTGFLELIAAARAAERPHRGLDAIPSDAPSVEDGWQYAYGSRSARRLTFWCTLCTRNAPSGIPVWPAFSIRGYILGPEVGWVALSTLRCPVMLLLIRRQKAVVGLVARAYLEPRNKIPPEPSRQ